MSEIIRTGGCLCGAVQLTITGEPAVMTYCHCESCRRWLGAPVHAGCLFPTKSVRIEKGGELLTTFKLTAESGSHRKFCMTCGSPVLNDHPSIGMTDIPAVSIPDLVFEPKLHSSGGVVASLFDAEDLLRVVRQQGAAANMAARSNPAW